MMKTPPSAVDLVVLDRDGVINQDSDTYIKTVDEWIPIPGSLEAIARLNHAGFRVVVASNQSGLGRGLFSIEELNAIHKKFRRELSVLGAQVDAIFFCPHKPDAHCLCRKPLPGLLEDIARRLRVDLTGVPFVGDTLADIQAASSVGAFPLLVLTGKGEKVVVQSRSNITGIPVFADLAAATDAILSP